MLEWWVQEGEGKQAQRTIAQSPLGCVLFLKENPVPSNSAQGRQCHWWVEVHMVWNQDLSIPPATYPSPLGTRGLVRGWDSQGTSDLHQQQVVSIPTQKLCMHTHSSVIHSYPVQFNQVFIKLLPCSRCWASHAHSLKSLKSKGTGWWAPTLNQQASQCAKC